MAKLVALNNQVHKDLCVHTAKAEEEGADLHMIPVVMSEFLKLVVQFPILFSKNAETGHFVCVALLGLEESENLFWQQAQFEGIYVPLNIARQPFFVGQDEQSGDDYVVCVNQQSKALTRDPQQPGAERLFTPQGQPTEYLTSMQNCLAELIQGEQATQHFTETLLNMGLMTPLALDITFEDGKQAQIKGLYAVDEDKLADLDGDALISLKNQGYLQPIYTHLASLGQIYALIDRKNKSQQQPSPWFQAAEG